VPWSERRSDQGTDRSAPPIDSPAEHVVAPSSPTWQERQSGFGRRRV